MLNVDARFCYYSKDSTRAKNEHAYTTFDQPFILDKLLANVLIKQKRKYMQFVVLFYFVHGCP